KNNIRRRFFDSFEQSIERRGREHMNLVDYEDLKAVAGRCNVDIFDNYLADLFDLRVRVGIKREHVHRAAFSDLQAAWADVRIAVFTRVYARLVGAMTVQSLCKKPCRRGLTNAPSARKYVRVMQTAMFYGVTQRSRNVVLAGYLFKGLRP